MPKLRYWDEQTQDYVSVAPSQEEFDNYKDSTNIILSETATKEEVIELRSTVEFADVRLLGWVMNKEVIDGIQDAHYEFPFDGDIEEISAMCAKRGANGGVYLRVEKSEDMQTWNSTTTNSVNIKEDSYFDDKSHILFNKSVKKGEVFRVNVEQSGGVQNLTVNVRIKIKNFSGGFFP